MIYHHVFAEFYTTQCCIILLFTCLFGCFQFKFSTFFVEFSTSAGPYFVFVCIYRAQHFQNHSHTSTAVCNSYRHSLYYRDYVGWFYKCFSAHFFNFFCFSFFFGKSLVRVLVLVFQCVQAYIHDFSFFGCMQLYYRYTTIFS